MNENSETMDVEVSVVCRGCLKTGENVHKGDKCTVELYCNLLSIHLNPDELEAIYFCIYCKSFIRKMTKFIKQCCDVDMYLRRMCATLQNVAPVSALCLRTKVVVNSFVDKENVKTETWCQTDSDVPDDASSAMIKKEEIVKGGQCNDSCAPPTQASADLGTGEELKVEPWCSGDDGVSDDDLPLVMMKNGVDNGEAIFSGSMKSENSPAETRCRARRRKQKILELKKDETNGQETRSEHMGKGKSAKVTRVLFRRKNRRVEQKRHLPEGFSSRMVQETEEYSVIKLTKELVLEEMAARAKSEKYLQAPFKCVQCVKGYNFEDVLNNHMEKHSLDNGPHICELCSQCCPSVVSMRGHMKSHTTRYKCKVCEEVRLSRQHLLEHYANSHTGNAVAYRCGLCGYHTYKRTAMQRHGKKHSNDEQHSCEKCGKVFKKIESFRAHMLRHDKSRKYSCPECEQSFIYPSLLRAHQVTHDRSSDYYCVECDVKFKTRGNLMMHFKKSMAHRDPSMLIYSCQVCSKRFISQSAVVSHLSMMHNVKKQFPCSSCDKEYSSADARRSHEKRIHKQIKVPKRHACHLCNHTFEQRAVLIKHVRIHTGERPYACGECGLTFAQQGTRYTHMRLVHLKLPRSVKKSQDTQPNEYSVPESAKKCS